MKIDVQEVCSPVYRGCEDRCTPGQVTPSVGCCSMTLHTMASTLFIHCLLITALSHIATTEKVYTQYGIYEGFTEDIDGRQVNKFYGIPYAQPPIGDLRFRPPRSPAEGANVTVVAKIMKPACPQNAAIFTKVYAPHLRNNLTSEDCLYLNVYVPGTVDKFRNVPLAVMVWIHGGAFQFGTGSVRDGSRLALSGDVIVVTLNYRLGILGFLGTEDLVARGNFGLMDQVKALQWIQSNIVNFGGDPSKVTIFGESSGAYSVGLHMLSPLSNGLFIRAISQSGTAIMDGLNKHPLERTLQVAQRLNCSSVDKEAMPVVRMIRCLRSIPTNDLIKVDESIITLPPFAPTVDGQFLLREPNDIIKLGKYIGTVDYIIGLNSDEGMTALETHPAIKTGPGVNRTVFEALLSQTFLSRFPAPLPSSETDIVWSTLLSHYLPADEDPAAFRRRYLDANRDVFAAQTLQYANYHSKLAACYVYYFTHKPSGSHQPAYIGAAHEEDLQFVFGDITSSGTMKEIQLSVDWMKAWTSFAKNGKPSFQNDRIEWTKYSNSSDFYLDITVNMTKANVKTRLLESGSLLWNKVLPGIMSLNTRPDLSVSNTSDMRVSGIGMTALKQTSSKKDWGMSESQVEATMLSLILVVTFLAMVCAALVRMLCYVEKRKRKGQKEDVKTCKNNRAFVSDTAKNEENNLETVSLSGCSHRNPGEDTNFSLP